MQKRALGQGLWSVVEGREGLLNPVPMNGSRLLVILNVVRDADYHGLPGCAEERGPWELSIVRNHSFPNTVR